MPDESNELMYAAGCDMCEYVARTAASDDDTAAQKLSQDLAAHNLEVHGTETDVDEIVEPVKAKMRKVAE